MDNFLENFIEALKEETLPGVWSKGVQLSRNSKSIERLSPLSETSELKFKIQTTERMLAFQVTLWPKDQDAHCNCGSKAEPCHHVVAVATALKNGVIAAAEKTPPANALRYQWIRENGLTLKRELILGGKVVEFPSSLTSYIGGIHSGRINSPLPSVTPMDLKLDQHFKVDQLLLNAENAPAILSALSDLPPIAISGIEGVVTLTVNSSREMGAIEIVDEGSDAIRVRGGGSHEGYLIEGDKIRLSPPLVEERVVHARDFASFVRNDLPKLQELATVHLQTSRLPVMIAHEPKLRLKIEDAGTGSLFLSARIEYPKLGDSEILARDQRKEGVLIKEAREKYRVSIDQPLKLDAKAALEIREKLESPELRTRLDSLIPGLLSLKGTASIDTILKERETLMKLLAMKEKHAGTALTNSFQTLIDGILAPESSKSETSVRTIPSNLKTTLRDYQTIGVNFLIKRSESLGGAILADDMGLGKTLQTLAVLQKPSLVIAPTSLLQNWKQEAAKFRPELKAHVFHGSDREWNKNADVIISSYSLLRQEPERFLKMKWNTIVLDEAHVIRNADTQAAIASAHLRGDFRIALTGTPIQNHPRDLLSLFRFIAPGVFESEHDLDPKIFAPFFLRRTKTQVLESLPPKTHLEHWVELSDSERSAYEAVLAAGKTEIARRLEADEKLSPLTFFELLLRAREVCDHVGLVDQARWNQSSAKLARVRELVDELREEGHSVLVFSQWTRFLDRLEKEFEGTPLLRLDGSTQNRGDIVTEFQESEEPTVFLLSLHAGGVGLNLTKATHVIFCDPWWNPFVELQAEDRAYRIGQEKPVTIHRILASDTIETQIQKLKASKFEANDAVLNSKDLNEILEEL